MRKQIARRQTNPDMRARAAIYQSSAPQAALPLQALSKPIEQALTWRMMMSTTAKASKAPARKSPPSPKKLGVKAASGNGETGKSSSSKERTKRHKSSTPTLGPAGQSIKQGVALSMQGMEKIEVEIADLVRATVAQTLRAGGHIAQELNSVVRDVLGGAVEAAEQLGTELAVSIKAIARGVVNGVNDVQGDVSVAAKEIIKTSMRQAHLLGTDVATVALRAMGGIVQAVSETGGNVALISKVVVKSAVKVADGISHMTGDALRKVMAGTAEGLRDAAASKGKALPKAALSKPSKPVKAGKAVKSKARATARAGAKTGNGADSKRSLPASPAM
jgi:hypothetical protein